MLADWIKEARPRTLLLGVSNCAVGSALGFYYGSFNLLTVSIALLIIITSVLLQILANFANDYGDAFRGADKNGRLGPMRGAMSGAVSLAQLRHAMAIVILMAAFTGLIAVYLAVHDNLNVMASFLFLGAVSIIAAMFYTIGVAYGYKGLGDIAVFLFFGVVAVLGSQVMITNASGGGLEIYPDTLLLCISVGAASVMVLHVANMRDMAGDKDVGKRTLAVRLGNKLAAAYHIMLFLITLGSSVIACLSSHHSWQIAILVLALLPLLRSVIRVARYCRQAPKLVPELKATLIGVTLHHIAWMIVLTVDYWTYF